MSEKIFRWMHGRLLLIQLSWMVACGFFQEVITCLLYTSDAADERSSVDLGGRRIIKKKKKIELVGTRDMEYNLRHNPIK